MFLQMRSGMTRSCFVAALPEAARRPFHGRGRAVKGNHVSLKKSLMNLAGP